jgi:hypothetical protein
MGKTAAVDMDAVAVIDRRLRRDFFSERQQLDSTLRRALKRIVPCFCASVVRTLASDKHAGGVSDGTAVTVCSTRALVEQLQRQRRRV